jgi:hypothetical protein
MVVCDPDMPFFLPDDEGGIIRDFPARKTIGSVTPAGWHAVKK